MIYSFQWVLQKDFFPSVAHLFVCPSVTTTVLFALYSKNVKFQLNYLQGIQDDSIISGMSYDSAEVMGQKRRSGDELVPPAAVLPFWAHRLCQVPRAALGIWTVVTLTTTTEDLSSRKQFVVTNEH